MSAETVRFGLLCSMFEAMARDRSPAKKRGRLRTFLDRVYTDRSDYFSPVRLMLPALDRERGTYGLKESALAACLVEAVAISKDSQDALRLVNWRKGGARAGANAGNFALVACEVLQRRQGMASGGLKIKEVNNAFDELATKENRGEKAAILSSLIEKTNAVEMKWILMIILKDLKLGISEKSIFNEFHPDAEDLFNVTCDLKLVCEKLNDRSQRHKRQDIEVGKAVRPQLAMRVSDAATAWKKLHGKEIVAECKFDGDHIQVHRNGSEINYFSRNFLDHSEYAHGMSEVILQNVLEDRCILDGEMLVWDSSTKRFAEFGSNQEIAKAAREGLTSDRQLCYVAFDILYVGDTSVIHQSLSERHDLLRKVVKPVKGRLEILVPEGSLNDCRALDEPCWLIRAYNLEDIERFFKQTVENRYEAAVGKHWTLVSVLFFFCKKLMDGYWRDEGIVIKDLGSKWEPSDRSGKWLKLKPDYIHPGADLDVLILGGYFGSGRHGGEVAQFLLGLAEPSPPGVHPKRFLSFCRVGTGLSDDEVNSLAARLKPYLRKNDHPKKPPRFYEVTNNSKERPDVWIESPEKSVILSITSDIRTIKSEVFAAPYSLRFPRILRVRYDKPWHECLDVQTFVELVHSSDGSMQGGTNKHDNSSKRVTVSRKGERKFPVVPSHLVKTDISGVKEESHIFTNMMFYFANTPLAYSVDYFHKLVAENGGMFSMNLNDSVTHCIAAEKKGIRYQAATRRGDVIHHSWVLDCCAQKCLIHLQPKYYLFITESSKRKFQEEMDAFADYDYNDVKQIFNNMKGSHDLRSINYYRMKYCPSTSWCIFQGCNIYFIDSFDGIGADFKMISELSSRRTKLEVKLHGGEVAERLAGATHVVACVAKEWIKDFEELCKSFTPSEQRALHSKKLHILCHEWIEDCLSEGTKLSENEYNLRPETFEIPEREEDIGIAVSNETSNETEKPTAIVPDQRGEKRRGRPPTSISVKCPAIKPARLRARVGSRIAKIDKEESEGSDTPDDRADHSENSYEQEHKIGSKEEIDLGHPHAAKQVTSSPRKGKHVARADRPTWAWVASKRTKIKGDESRGNLSDYKSDSKDGSYWKTRERENTVQLKVEEDSGSSHRQQAIPEAYHDKKEGKEVARDEANKMDTFSSWKSGDAALDPVQAMLFEMIPSLSQRQKEIQELRMDEKQPEEEQPEEEIAPTNSKKKKVSYKDVAEKLLKDWL